MCKNSIIFKNNKVKKIVFFIVLLIITFFSLGYLLIISIPNNPVVLRHDFFNNKKINLIIPEGWAFFTRNPREKQLLVYKIDKKRELHEISLKNSEANQYFGILRTHRMIASKLERITSGIADKYWYLTTDSVGKILLDSCNVFSQVIEKPSICGKFLLIRKRPMPWSYFNSTIKDKIKIQKESVIVNFICES